MKKSAYLLILFSLLNCTPRAPKIESSSLNTPKRQVKGCNNAFGDKPAVVLGSGDNCKLSRVVFDAILKRNPGLNDEITQAPDIGYAMQIKNADFESEQGRDEYYMLYAYLLRGKNGEARYHAQRNNLINIYRHINSVFGKLAHGGTYFAHQYSRIPGHAEHSIYLQSCNDFSKKYSISAQKNLYLKSLRQLISDEVSFDHEIAGGEKLQLKKELFETVDSLGGLITNYFYLKRAQEFQSSNY